MAAGNSPSYVFGSLLTEFFLVAGVSGFCSLNCMSPVSDTRCVSRSPSSVPGHQPWRVVPPELALCHTRRRAVREGSTLRGSLVPVTVHLLGAGSSGACPVQARGPLAAKRQDPPALCWFIHSSNKHF